MIEYSIIICIALLQHAGYRVLDKKGIRFPKWILLIALLLGQLFVFPQLLFSFYGFDEIKCGMPILVLHLFFLVLGGSLNVITHLVYYFKLRLKKTA